MLRTLECDRMQSLFTNITTAKLPVTECDHEFFRECSHGNLFRSRKRTSGILFSFTNVTTDNFCCRMSPRSIFFFFYKCGHYSLRHECDH
jgi:hypothetical protein